MDKYKIISINNDGTVSVAFSVDNKAQRLSNVPLDSKESLEAYLSSYNKAYKAGLEIEAKPTASEEVSNLVGIEQPLPVEGGSV